MEIEEHTTTSAGCKILGLSRATVYRHRAPKMLAPVRKPGGGAQPNALTDDEVSEVFDLLTSDRFVDKAPEQVWAILLDEGTYLCSPATMYRILRARDAVRERRDQGSHPPRKIPELLATGPDQVWCWDITKLRGPRRGTWYCAYVMIDIFSRKIIHAEVHHHERELLAEEFIEAAIAANAGVVPGYIHSDNGTPMIAGNVTDLLHRLNITASLSRPRVSNDNPYIESWYKTLKYAPVFPEAFGSLEDARAFLTAFVTYYNNDHRHSEIGLHTPVSVHDGSYRTIDTRRQATLDQAHAAHPERFRNGPPTTPQLPQEVWINKPDIHTSKDTSKAA